MHMKFSMFVRIVLLLPVIVFPNGCSETEPTAESMKVDWTTLPDTKMNIAFSMEAPGGNTVEGMSKVVFSKNYAVSAMYDPNGRYGNHWDSFMVFDLAAMAWYDTGLQQWIDLKLCREWEKASIDRTKASLQKSADNGARSFVEATINPNFQTEVNSDGQLVLKNNHMYYAITPADTAAPQLLERYIAYDRLNAYHKAMTERKLPPTAQLAVVDVLARRKVLPKQLTARIKTANGDVVMTTDTQIDAFDEEDAEHMRQALSMLEKD